ncbi:MAG: ATP-dependent DNA helicase RecQ [Opitutales bacterium]|nr:ATP-dependent DNA helicase RecQ [Opitutales bacterium]
MMTNREATEAAEATATTEEAVLEEALRTHFGFSAFRPGQDEIIAAICAGRDVLAVMPTGGGKSICYQLPALLLEGTAVVVSPLIALMKDQVDALEARGIPATLINSSLGASEQGRRIRAMGEGAYKMVYVAPERFRHAFFLEQFKRARVSFFAVDEAHCVSQWGHDFRPDYLRIGEAIRAVGRPPVSAFTATATEEVRRDIVTSLGLRDPGEFVRGFARPNLEFRVSAVAKRAEKLARLSAVIDEAKKGIVYCATRKRVEEVAEHLEEWGVPHIAYHAGLDDAERERRQNEFISGRADVAVATNAFGMGIDRADIRFVVHFEIPGSVEAYYQEAGRAGRDGLPSVCELLFNYADRKTQDFFIDGRNPPVSFIRDVYDLVRRAANPAGEVLLSIQELTDLLDGGNSMMVGTALKYLSRCDYIQRYDIPGERKRGTRLLDPAKSGGDLAFDEAALQEKEQRDRAKLEAMLAYVGCRTCRQEWIQRFFGEKDAQACHSCDTCQALGSNRIRPLREEEIVTLQKALSGVARMSGRNALEGWVPRYGLGLITRMLVGSEEQRLAELRLNQLSTYGLLKEEGRDFVRDLLEECLRFGLLRSTGGTLPMVTLTPLGEAVMKRETPPRLIWPKVRKAAKGLPRGKAREPLVLDGAGDTDLLETLKKKRAQLARVRGGVPPYHIFSNRVLEELAARRPATVEEALDIPGIGPAKAKSLLPSFLKLIAEAKRND